jgi:tRNA modification GTPase
VSHQVYYGHVVDESGRILDEALLLPMLRPRSYTVEDVIELHCHGGGVCAERVLQACLKHGCRLASPGEFTLRAFLNGRLDLSQAESVAQLVTARTGTAADSALAGLQVSLHHDCHSLAS